MPHHVFISFSSKDIETSLRVYEGLTSRGISCWISHKDVPPGGNYMEEIPNALASSSVMILILSKNANLSGEIPKELALAAQHQLTVIPLKIDEVVPSGAFKYSLATSQWIEVFPHFEQQLDKVADTITALVERSVDRSAQSPVVVDPVEKRSDLDLGNLDAPLPQEHSKESLTVEPTTAELNRDTITESLQLFQLGMDVMAIAKQRGLKQETIYEHLAKAAAEGRADMMRVTELSAQQLAEIRAAYSGESRGLKSVSDALDKRYSDAILRCVRVWIERKDEQLKNWDYHALGEIQASEVLSHPEANRLIEGIAWFAQKSEQTVRKDLKNAIPDGLVKDVVKNYQKILNPDFLASITIATARDMALGKIIAETFEISDQHEIKKILNKTHGKTRLGTAFYDLSPRLKLK